MAETLEEIAKLGTVHSRDLAALLAARHHDPFSVLGPHAVERNGETLLAVRAFVPGAVEIEVLPRGGGEPIPAGRIHPAGFFEAVFGPVGEDFRYRLRIHRAGGHVWECEDPYRFGRVLTDFDIHLLGEGTHLRSFEKLGAHTAELDGVKGVHFAVWAPNAERVSVIGPFNDWDGRRHPMRNLGASGLWEFFLPGLVEGDLYKFEIRSNAGGHLRVKSDPYAFRSEVRPGTASIVHTLDKHHWRDEAWLQEGRQRRNALDAPISVYEVHLGSWMRGDGDRFLTYRELAERLVAHVKDMGFTHIELLPVLEHPFDGSWGYQPLGYFSPTSRFGLPEDFAAFIDACHGAEIGVFLDWVPAHFPRDEHGLRLFDGTHLYEHADPRQGEHRDWGTLIFNYGRNEVRNFLLGNAIFWLDKYHLDGIRVDAVASMLYLDYSRQEGDWIPNQYGGRENLPAIDFLKRMNELCHLHYPGVLTIAEESTAWPGVSRPTYLGGLGFSLKWNMGWMNDTLSYFAREPVHRKYHQQNLTFSLLYAFTENFILPFSHDEVVHGKRSLLDKMPGDGWQKFANLRLLYAFQFTHPGKKLLFMGGEFGQGREWIDGQSLDWHLLGIDYHRGIRRLVRELNRLYRSEPALHQIEFDWNGFEWIDFHDWESSILSYIRRGRDPGEELAVILNFTPVPRWGYRIGVPSPGYYREILNSDSEHYCGSNLGNSGGVQAEAVPAHGRPWSLSLTLPPLAGLVLKRQA
jgi:1,4-alpha-glucan branching enzyme